MGDVEQKIRERTDLAVAAATQISEQFGGLAFRDMGQVMEFAKLMAVSGQAVPKHLRGQPGACLAVATQALNWRMDPFQVANKSYAVNDRIAYEAQLVQAVIEQRAPIKGRIKGRYEGEGSDRRLILTCVSAEDGSEIEYVSPKVGQIKVKNSPLWTTEPDQQLWYYSARAMCRRHFPDVLLGVYEKEELREAGEMRDVTPKEGPNLAQQMAAEPEVEPAEIVPAFDESEAFPGDEAFEQGARAFRNGDTMSDNPHSENPAYSCWIGGYEAARQAQEAEE